MSRRRTNKPPERAVERQVKQLNERGLEEQGSIKQTPLKKFKYLVLLFFKVKNAMGFAEAPVLSPEVQNSDFLKSWRLLKSTALIT